MNTTGYLYLAITTEDESLTEDDFSQNLSLKATRFNKKNEKGNIPVETSWQFRSEHIVNTNYEDEVEQLIDKLYPYQLEFQNFKKKFTHVSFYLVVVIFCGEQSPGLNF